MNPYLILSLGALGLWYGLPAWALLRLEFELRAFDIIAIRADYIDISVSLELKNNTPVSFTVSRIDASVYFNGAYVSEMYALNIAVPSSGTGYARANIRLRKEALGAAIWNVLINNSFSNSEIAFNGQAKAGLRTYPFSSKMLISDIGEE